MTWIKVLRVTHQWKPHGRVTILANRKIYTIFDAKQLLPFVINCCDVGKVTRKLRFCFSVATSGNFIIKQMAATHWWKESTDYDTTRVKIRVLYSTWRNLSYVDLNIWFTMCLCDLKENLWRSGNIPQCSVLWRRRGTLVTHRNKYCNHVLTKSFVVERLKRQYYPFVGITKSATHVAFL